MRRKLAIQSINAATELMIGDNNTMTVPQARAYLEDTLTLYRRVHYGLRFGDEGLGLPRSNGKIRELDALMYGEYEALSLSPEAGNHVVSALNVNTGVLPNSPNFQNQAFSDAIGDATILASGGADGLLREFWHSAEDIVDRYGDPSAARPGRDFTALLEDPSFARMWMIQWGVMGKALGVAVEQY
jgi:hypothetical protein